MILLIIIYFLLKNTSETNYGEYLNVYLLLLSMGLFFSIYVNLLRLARNIGSRIIIFSIFIIVIIIIFSILGFYSKKIIFSDISIIIFNIICLTLYIISHTLQHYREQKLEDSIKTNLIYKVNTKD